MLIDLTTLVSEYDSNAALQSGIIVALGHLGTHFDVMDKEFPLDFIKRNGLVFNVKDIFDREISTSDIDLSLVKPEMFIAFYSGFIENFHYGTSEYFSKHPQLSNDLIDALVSKSISLIGIDFAGIRRGAEHTLKDQYCADHGVFVIENLCNLFPVIREDRYKYCILNTYPVKFAGLSGLPCRVVAEI